MTTAETESPEGRFVHELALTVDFATEREIRLRFDVARKLYNALLGEALRRVRRVRHELERTPTHRALFAASKVEADAAITQNELDLRGADAKAIRKKAFAPYNDVRKKLLRDHKCSRFGLSSYGTELSRKTPLFARSHAIGATVVQELVRRAWQTAEKYMLDPRIKCKFIRYGDMHSVESMNEADAIRVVGDRVIWSSGARGGIVGMRMRLDRKGRDWVEQHARREEIVKTRIVRRVIRGRVRSAAQIVLAGSPVERPWITTQAGEDVGIDLGLSVVAVDSDAGSAIYSLTTVSPEQRAALGLKQRRINRALDRSRRASNPQNYDEKRRIKPRNQRTRWTTTATYRTHKTEYAEASRRLTEQRKNATRTLVNHIASLGNVGVIENLSLKKWQQEYGRATGFAPGEFTVALERRMLALNGSLHKIPAYTAKLSQFCIACGVYEKRDFAIRVLERRQRCSRCESDQNGVQADLVQAFLARHVRVEGTIDESQARKAWAGASTRLGLASSTVKNVAKTVLARSRQWRNSLAAELRAMQSGSASPLGFESSSRAPKERGEGVSVKESLLSTYRAPRWGNADAEALDAAITRKKRRKGSGVLRSGP